MSINTSVGKYTVSFEAVHHGPYSKIPSIFLEVGSEEKNWNDSEAAEFASKALFLALKSEIKPKDSIFIMGGNHYCAAAYDFIKSLILQEAAPNIIMSALQKSNYYSFHKIMIICFLIIIA